MINTYWKYFKYIIEHKKNVGIECLKMGMPLHAITHDLSKFLPSEFIPYAKWFYGEHGNTFNGGMAWEHTEYEINRDNFESAWKSHYNINKHHWNYWVSNDHYKTPQPMPKKYVKQMIADWRGMSRKFGDSAKGYYIKNKDNMLLHEETVRLIEEII